MLGLYVIDEHPLWFAVAAGALLGFVGFHVWREFRDRRSRIPWSFEPTPTVPFGHVDDEIEWWAWILTNHELRELDPLEFDNLDSFLKLGLLTNGVIDDEGMALRTIVWTHDTADERWVIRWNKTHPSEHAWR